MDSEGNIKQRFPATEPFNLWKLIHLSDFILQQTTYFRKSVFDDVGYVDEGLHWGMDWDLLIRIAKRYKITYIPEFMGCIREYPEAKSFAGGPQRFKELAAIMRRHTERRIPPGYITYGLDTYGPIWCDWIRRLTPAVLCVPSQKMQRVVYCATRYIIDWTLRSAQGLYSDGWAGPTVKYMLRQGHGRISIRGCLPDLGRHLANQNLTVTCNGSVLARKSLSAGDFEVMINAPLECAHRPSNFVLRASRFFVPKAHRMSSDGRRLSYMLTAFDWA
jgi:hypothetical protein